MRVLLAPDSFKGALSAARLVDAMAEGVRRAWPHAELDRCPLADGGEGTLDVLVQALGGERRRATVTSLDREPVEAEWALLDDGRAVVEAAEVVGLARFGPGRPGERTTQGVGELIRTALDAGASRVVVALGGSATVDAGLGAAAALGLPLEPAPGRDVAAWIEALSDVGSLALPIDLLCDVGTTLVSAPALYGPQKGADAVQIAALEAAFAHLVRLAAPDGPRMGAAGGLAYGLSLCGGVLHDGIGAVLDAVGFAERAAHADWVLTGEGRLDGQTAEGKVVAGVLRAGRPTWAFVGSAAEVRLAGLSGHTVISPPELPLAEALAQTRDRMAAAVASWATARSGSPGTPR